MLNLINRRKQKILLTIFSLTIFSYQSLLAQEEAQEIKIENKNEFIQEETQLSTENLPKEEVTPITETPKQEKASTTKKKSSKKEKKKKRKKQSRVILECKPLKHFLMKKRLKKKETQNG